jgi:glyoxylate utilization-related uncharacterized protein
VSSDELINPHSGQRLRFVSSEPELLVLETTYAPGGPPPPAHLHPEQDEHFEVLEGELHAVVAGEEMRVGAGETLDVPSGTVHAMWGGSEVETRVRWETRPRLRTDEFLRKVWGFAAGTEEGDPMAILAQYEREFRLAT